MPVLGPDYPRPDHRPSEPRASTHFETVVDDPSFIARRQDRASERSETYVVAAEGGKNTLSLLAEHDTVTLPKSPRFPNL